MAHHVEKKSAITVPNQDFTSPLNIPPDITYCVPLTIASLSSIYL